MTAVHLELEELSAYLDGAMITADAVSAGHHLTTCEHCRERLDGLRDTVAALRTLERPAPPVEVQLTVVRRVARATLQPRVWQRFEGTLAAVPVHSPLMPVFVLTVLLSTTLYLLALLLAQDHNPSRTLTVIAPVVASDLRRINLAGRDLVEDPAGWVESVLTAESTVSRRVDQDAAGFWRANPELMALSALDGRVLVLVDGEVVEIVGTVDAGHMGERRRGLPAPRG